MFWPIRGSIDGCGSQSSFSRPLKSTENCSLRNRKRTLRNKGFILSRKFTSPTPEPLSGTVSTLKCYCLMFSTPGGTRAREFDPTTSTPDLLIWKSPLPGLSTKPNACMPSLEETEETWHAEGTDSNMVGWRGSIATLTNVLNSISQSIAKFVGQFLQCDTLKYTSTSTMDLSKPTVRSQARQQKLLRFSRGSNGWLLNLPLLFCLQHSNQLVCQCLCKSVLGCTCIKIPLTTSLSFSASPKKWRG